MMFDRFIRHVNDVHGSNFLFSCIDSLLKNADFALGNLEGPITANPSISEGTVIGSPENYRFTFPPGTADLLLQHNIKVVSIGNNHIGDYGGAGISSTHDYLTRAGVAYFGGLAGDSPVYRTTDHGIDLSFVNFNQFGGDSAEKVAQIISSEHAQNRVVIVYAHWGIEYVDAPQSVRDVARLFANSGANLIIGSHPHITQTHEMIDGTPVYYSLGNFIFDQYFEPNVTKGLALLVHISSKNKITIDEKPVVLNPDGRTCLL
jgi:poly-gamma-glutamate synthesis protein (capsule biosynthesis protein)